MAGMEIDTGLDGGSSGRDFVRVFLEVAFSVPGFSVLGFSVLGFTVLGF
ncbi:MAG: hypothetical protein L0H41_03010 [Microlunatus sp.]|nr:hypothetical protein [Microlunatus sp.]MDN5771032.1 hypothetical protein [Microlunatus sp.]